MMMNVDEGIKILEKQEELLQFTHFNRLDAWKLGKEIVTKTQDEGFALAVSLRLRDGFTLFQYFPEGTTLNNGSWMNRKFNTVQTFEHSTLLHTVRLIKQGKTFETSGLDPKVYVWGGGGFPIRVKGTGVIGVATVSGLPGLQDHDVIVECLSRVLRVKDVPHIPLDAGF
jgi:uncharacterized protein (UPF0303 family)